MTVAENVRSVEARIDEAAKKAGRSLKDITLVAVTKGFGADAVMAARDAGVKVFAENRVQEAQAKISEVPAEWHLVGHLQTNKVDAAISLFNLIQSVDSARLAEKINEAAAARNVPVSVLLEINISGEPQKYGFAPEEIYGAADAIKPLSHVRVEGLMGIAPNTQDMEARRAAFKKLRSIFSVCKSMKHENFQMKHLSMGMSDDFEIAVEEGSTMVRVGRALFGERKA